MSFPIKRIVVSSIAGAGAWLPVVPVTAQEPAPPVAVLSVHAETRLVSRYLWRGYDLSRGRPAVQPYLEATHRSGLGMNGFGTMALDGTAEIDEGQLGLSYRRELGGPWSVSGGVLAYLMPGTETEPGADPDDPLAASASGEGFLAMGYQAERVGVTLTYSRGVASAAGNGVNLWVEGSLDWSGGRWSAAPYAQLDYLDQYGAPRGLKDRVAAVELGLPVSVALRGASLGVGAHLTWSPSPYVRDANAAAGVFGAAIAPWLSFTVSFDRE